VPPPPPAPRVIDERAAVKIAADHVRSRGLVVDRFRADLDAHGHWRVELASTHGKDRARVLVDAATGRVLKAALRDVPAGDDWEDF
jgi:hypothetical protein